MIEWGFAAGSIGSSRAALQAVAELLGIPLGEL